MELVSLKHSWRSCLFLCLFVGLFAALVGPLRLSLLVPLRFAPGDVSRLDLQRQLPQRLLGQVVAEVVEEGDDVVVAFQLVVPGNENNTT